ncbi:MAG: RNA polymerase sigma factor [Mangrovibacterium sp.]
MNHCKNKKQFNAIYDQYWSQLYAYAFNIVKNREVAEDVVQEIFTDLWSRIGSSEIENYKAYLFRAVKFQCAKKMPDLHVALLSEELIAADECDEVVEKEVLFQYIKNQARTLLPEKCLQIFQMRYIENLSYKEIASELAISNRTVDNQLHKALKMIRAAM